MLTKVIDAIWATNIPLGEKRRLAGRASVALLVGQPDHTKEEMAADASCTTFERFEEVLVAVGELEGTPKPSVSQAKAALRGYGVQGRQMASRLGRFSKLRNGRAHPDVSLASDIGSLRSEFSCGSGTEGQCQSSASEPVLEETLVEELGTSNTAEPPKSTPSREAWADVVSSGEEAAEHPELGVDMAQTGEAATSGKFCKVGEDCQVRSSRSPTSRASVEDELPQARAERFIKQVEKFARESKIPASALLRVLKRQGIEFPR